MRKIRAKKENKNKYFNNKSTKKNCQFIVLVDDNLYLTWTSQILFVGPLTVGQWLDPKFSSPKNKFSFKLNFQYHFDTHNFVQQFGLGCVFDASQFKSYLKGSKG